MKYEPYFFDCRYYNGWYQSCDLKDCKCNKKCEDFLTTRQYYDKLFANVEDENTYVSLADIRKVLVEDISKVDWVGEALTSSLFDEMKEQFIKRKMCKNG